MLAKVISGATAGLDALPVTVEVDIAAAGLPSFAIVGLADRAVEEAKERVRSAIRNIGADFPARRITVNLAPADVPKEGPVFDLAIAIGLLKASGQIEGNIDDSLFAGELSLDGSLRPVGGILPLAILGKERGLKRFFLPKDNAKEASVIEDLGVYPLDSLKELVLYLNNQIKLSTQPPMKVDLKVDGAYEFDFSQIKGQEQAKRALEIAAAGAHNVLMKGPPGAGKTLLARSFPSILPSLTLNEALEITKIYSITGNLSYSSPLVINRPFRHPHHTASYVGLIGGGGSIRPGEISLAHRGVLFLDEIPEFPRQVLEALRQPLEDKKVTISRANGSLTFPSQFILIATQNPCPCGYLGSPKKNCICLPGQISKYQKKVSGPLLDRVDIHLDVPAVEIEKLTGEISSEKSEKIRARVEKAREIQRNRFKNSDILTNSEMSNIQIKEFCTISNEAMDLLKMAISQMNLSARAYHRVLKLSRTIADLSENENILTEHVAEALQYRVKDEG